MHIVNRPNDMNFFFGKFDQVVIWYLIDMHRTYRVFFSYYMYMGEIDFLIENPIYKIFYTNQGGRSGLWWLGKIRHHYAGNLLIFPLIFSRFFFQYSLLLSDPYTTTLPIRLNGSPCFFCIFWFVKPLSKFVKPF